MTAPRATESTASDTQTSAFSLSALFGVKGRTALVTGGGSGLGSYAALALALQGATVYIVGRRQDKLDGVVADFEARKQEKDADPAAKEGKIVALKGDVSSRENIQAIVDAYGKHQQHLDVLINGAGLLRLPAPADKNDGDAVVKSLWEQDWNDFTDLYNVNVTSLHYLTLAMVPFLRKATPTSYDSPGPVVLNIASISGLHINRGTSIPYQTSKDAAIKLTQIQAGRLIPLKIRVNCVSPGVFASEMTGARHHSDFDKPDHPFHSAVTTNPIKRTGTVEDFAGLVLFLSSRAGAYLNGANIVIDGGRVLMQSAA